MKHYHSTTVVVQVVSTDVRIQTYSLIHLIWCCYVQNIYGLFKLHYEGDGQVINWDRELQNALVTSTGEAWLNPASESEDSSRSGSEPRADRSMAR